MLENLLKQLLNLLTKIGFDQQKFLIELKKTEEKKDSNSNKLLKSIEKIRVIIKKNKVPRTISIDNFPKVSSNKKVVEALRDVEEEINILRNKKSEKIKIEKPEWYKSFSVLAIAKTLAHKIFSVNIKNRPDVVITDKKGKAVDFTKLGGQTMVSGGHRRVGLLDSSDKKINPATEEGLDNIVTAVNNSGGGGGFEVVGIKDESDARINPATEENQLPDNHHVVISNTNLAKEAKQDDIITAITASSGAEIEYAYMGKDITSDTDYEYFGFKQNGGENYKIMRKEIADDKAWKYAYGTSGFVTAWANPSLLIFDNPPN